MIDQVALEKAARIIIEAIGDDPRREGLVETPKRFAGMMAELLDGMNYTNHQVAQMFGKCFSSDSDGMVVERDVPVFSFCEHHLALMYDMRVSVCYIPNGKVIGLSKIARIAETCAKRLQLQERITQDIWDVLGEVLGTEDVIVLVKGKHSCMTARGIKKPEAHTITNVYGGCFKEDSALRVEAMALLRD
ncbi:MAG: GTP cyclohydrolase I FolE [Coriobacteriales bacterium]|nr:GTP cyclohydrolase I FolE [Coriobacteriales bacterium]